MTRKSLCKSTLSDSKLTLHGRRLTTWSRDHPQSYDAFTAACVQWTCLPCRQVHVGRGKRNNGPGETTASAAATLCKYKQLMPFKAMHRPVKGSDMRPCTVGLTGALLTRYHSQHRPSITQESFSWDLQVNAQCLTSEPRLLFRTHWIILLCILTKTKLSRVFTCPQIFIIYIVIVKQKGVMQTTRFVDV